MYPAGLEEIRKYGEQTVQFRPAKPVDDRRIQEHFYALDKKMWWPGFSTKKPAS
ncbi:MAG: hypothetical protein R2875_13120 [Desulfobacterales bacterium]